MADFFSQVVGTTVEWTEIVDYRVLGKPAEKNLPNGKVLPKSAPIIATLSSRIISDTILQKSRNKGFNAGPRFSRVFPFRLQNEVDRLREKGTKIYKDKNRFTRVIPKSHPDFGKVLVLQSRSKEETFWMTEEQEKIPLLNS
jgi:hypothetical protein